MRSGANKPVNSNNNPELLNRTRYIWLKNPENLTDKQRARLRYLEGLNLRCNCAYLLKESFREFWEYKHKDGAKRFINKWFWWATHTKKAAGATKRNATGGHGHLVGLKG